MEYQLAKKLKDAGFPQKFINPEYYLEKNAPPDTLEEHTAEVRKHGIGGVGWTISQPTLEELITACGREFGSLKMVEPMEEWIAREFEGERFGAAHHPVEAVARLWLALNASQPSRMTAH